MKRDAFEWALEKEPTYSGRPRPIIPLAFAGAVRSYIERSHPVSRCSCCEKPTAGVRCKECQAIDARACSCGLWTVRGEACCADCGQERAA